MLKLSKVRDGGEPLLDEMQMSAQCSDCIARLGLVRSCLEPGQTVRDLPLELQAATLGCQAGPQRDHEYDTVACPVADEMEAAVQHIRQHLAAHAVANATE